MVLGLNLLRCSSAEQANTLCKFYSKYYNSEERKGSLKKKEKANTRSGLSGITQTFWHCQAFLFVRIINPQCVRGIKLSYHCKNLDTIIIPRYCQFGRKLTKFVSRNEEISSGITLSQTDSC